MTFPNTDQTLSFKRKKKKRNTCTGSWLHYKHVTFTNQKNGRWSTHTQWDKTYHDKPGDDYTRWIKKKKKLEQGGKKEIKCKKINTPKQNHMKSRVRRNNQPMNLFQDTHTHSNLWTGKLQNQFIVMWRKKMHLFGEQCSLHGLRSW